MVTSNTGSNLALLGGKPVRDRPLPLVPIIGEEEKQAVMEVLDSGRLSAASHTNIMGADRARRFEEEFAAFCGAKHAVAVNSGTAALHVALAASGIGPGDEVLVPSYTFTATASAVLMHNAIPIFVDVEPHSFCMDPAKAEEAISPATRAMIPVHLLGNVADMDSLLDIARRHNLIVIEDTAQSPGAALVGRVAGTMGELGTFSFQESKNMMTGEGGMVITDREELAERCRLVRNHGEVFMQDKARSYVANILGWNYRVTEMEAALGRVQLRHLAQWNEIRRENAAYLSEHLAGSPFAPPYVAEGVRHVFHLFGMRYDEQEVGVPRSVIMEALAAEGIPSTSGYPHPLYKNPLFQERLVYGAEGCPFTCNRHNRREVDYSQVHHPVAEDLCSSRAIWTDMVRPPLGIDDMREVVSAIEKILDHLPELRQYAITREGQG